MRKYLTVLLICIGLLAVGPPAWAIKNFTAPTTASMKAGLYTDGVTSGTYTYSALSTGDCVSIFTSTYMRVYRYNATSGQVDDDNVYITPSYSASGVAYSGNARWEKIFDSDDASGMVYPGAGVPNCVGGTAWGTSYAVGTAANNLVQLNPSAQLPAVSGALLTNVNAASLNGHADTYFATAGANSNITSLSGLTTALSMAQGGTGQVLSDPGSHVLWGWNNTSNVFTPVTIGTNLSFDPNTNTISASSTAGASFGEITGGTNTSAAMVVGTGGSINFTGTGSINASTLQGNAASAFAAAGHTHDYSSVFEAKDTTILKSGTTLGTFTGTTIPDSQTISQALQALETAIEGIEVGGLSDLDDLPGDSVDDNLIDAALLADLSSIYSTTDHTHTGSTISGIDISDDTNLSGDTEIVLTGDALSIASGITRDAEWDSIAEIEAATGVNIIVNAEIDSLAEINAIVGVTLLSTSSGIDASNINSGTIGVAYLPSDLSSMTSLILPSNTTVAHETGVADSSSYMSADDTHTVTVSAPASMADDADLTWPTSDGVLAIIADIEALIDDTAGIGNEALVWSADKIAGELASIRSTMGTGTGDMLLGTEQVVTALKTFNNDTLSAGGIKFDSTPDAAGEVGYATAAYRFLGGATIEDIHFHATENLWTIGSDTGATFAFTPSVTFTAGGIIGTTSHLQFGDSGTYIAQLNDGHLDLEADTSIDLNAPIVIGGDVALGTNEIQSTGNIVLQLGDAAGTNKLSIQDSGGNEVYSINSDGQATAIAGANPALTLGDSDAPGSEAADKQVGQLWSEYVSGDPDEENSSIGLKAMVAGTLTDIFWYGAASDTVWSARDLDVTGKVYTSGGIDFDGAQTPNMQAGLLTWDTLISGVNSGGLVWNDGATTRIIVDIPPTATLTDGHAVVYESDDGGHFTLAEAGSGSMTYPTGTGIAVVSDGSSWGTTITPGTGVATALAINVGGAGAFATNDGSAANMTVVATGFDGNLATTDDTLQEIAQKLDDLVATGGAGTPGGDGTPDGQIQYANANNDGLSGEDAFYYDAPNDTLHVAHVSCTDSIAMGADPGDSGAIRLSNNTALSWEQSTPGTDIFIALDSSDILQVGQNCADIRLGTSGTGNVTVTGDLTVTGSDISVGATGVKITGDGDGAITLLGLGDGSNEDLTINLDDTANTVKLSSSTGVTDMDFSAINLVTTGTITGRVPMITIDSARSLTAAECHGGFVMITAAGTYPLPAAATAGYGSTVCIYVRDASETVVIEVDGSDKINLNGTALNAGDTIDSAGNAGDFICLISTTDADGSGTDGWRTLGKSGTWTDGGAN